MAKTLDEAIGCWTTSNDGLISHSKNISEAVRWCHQKTNKGNPRSLITDLLILRGRLGAMVEITDGALARCTEIIATNELNSEIR